jgi:pectate lyase
MIMTHSSLRTLLLPILFAVACGGTGSKTVGGQGGSAGAGGSGSAAGSGGASDTGAAMGGSPRGGAGTGGIGAGGNAGGSGGGGGGTLAGNSGGGASSGRGGSSGGATAGNSGGGPPAAEAGAPGGAIGSSGGMIGSSGGTVSSSGGTTGSSGGAVGGRGGTLPNGGTPSGGVAAGSRAGGSTSSGGGGGAAGSGGSAVGGTRDAGVAGGNRDAGSTATGGAGGTGDCTTPPAASPLIGWATASGSTTGGGNAAPVTVTTLAALQSAVKGTTAAVIYVKGVLAPGAVSIGSNKTIVGLCGAEIHGHLAINKSSNVILRNIKIVGYAVGNCALDPSYSSATGCSSGDDAISIEGQSDHIWLDHDDISDGTDGNLDITHACDFITVSWTKFHYSSARTDPTGSDSTGANGHRFSNLVGHSDSNASEDTGHLTITWHHNWWADYVVERQPRVRFGRVHVFNNLYTSVGDDYCIGVGVGANLRTENNVFVGVKTPIDTTGYSDSTSASRSTGNLYSGTTGNAPADLQASSVFDPASLYTYTLDDTSGLQAAIESGAGPK